MKKTRTMSHRTITAALLAAAALLAGVSAAQEAAEEPEAPGTMLRLRSGDVAFGQIVAHDPDGIRVRLLASALLDRRLRRRAR